MMRPGDAEAFERVGEHLQGRRLPRWPGRCVVATIAEIVANVAADPQREQVDRRRLGASKAGALRAKLAEWRRELRGLGQPPVLDAAGKRALALRRLPWTEREVAIAGAEAFAAELVREGVSGSRAQHARKTAP